MQCTVYKFCLRRFLLQCLEDLDRSLRKLNSRLFVIRGQPADALPKLFKVSVTFLKYTARSKFYGIFFPSGMGYNVLDFRRGPRAVWPRQGPEHNGALQGTWSQCHISHFAHTLRPGKVRYESAVVL